jgi:hypothetical protein
MACPGAAEFIVQPPFDGSFTSREGKQSYIIREPRTPAARTLHAFHRLPAGFPSI